MDSRVVICRKKACAQVSEATAVSAAAGASRAKAAGHVSQAESSSVSDRNSRKIRLAHGFIPAASLSKK